MTLHEPGIGPASPNAADGPVSRSNGNLARTIHKPDDFAARSSMAQAALEAGLAFTNAILGATHAMSHQVGGLLDLPHGYLLPFESLATPLFDLDLSTILPLESKGWLQHSARLPLESKGWLQPKVKLPFESGGTDPAAVEVRFDIFRALNSPIPAFFDIVSNLPAPEPIVVEFDIFEGVASASVSFDIFSEKLQDARCADVQMPIAKWEIF